MKVRYTGGPWMWAVEAAALVYRETVGRARLLSKTLRRDDADIAFDLTFIANAEPTAVPEPVLRSKVS